MKGAPNNSSFLNQRRHEEAPEDSICKRDAFQRDRDRIMHSRAFRRMMHKTQIFNANMGGDYPEFCVTAQMRCKIELDISRRERRWLRPPCLQHNANGGGSQGAPSSIGASPAI